MTIYYSFQCIPYMYNIHSGLGKCFMVWFMPPGMVFTIISYKDGDRNPPFR